MNLNKFQFIGRLTKDPEQYFSQNGTEISYITIAVNGRKKEEEADFFRVKAFGKLAELCDKYITKGQEVYIEGRVKSSQIQTEDGKRLYKTEFIANKVEFGSKPKQYDEVEF